MKKTIALAILVITLIIGGYICIKYYSYVFAKRVSGEVISIERVSQPEAIITTGSAIPASQIFSFALAIRSKDGQIHTASSEDRQWAVVHQGQCVEAKFFPYPIWEFEKGGTYFGARLTRLYDCDPATHSPPEEKTQEQEHPKPTESSGSPIKTNFD